jgi:membrane-bound metal-dependent hydrolase YbcI (DUF457 family)
MPFFLTGAMLLFDRLSARWFRRTISYSENPRPPLKPGILLGLSFIAVWSHPFLDWLNVYGVRLLMPFSETWFYGDSFFIIDPWLWLLMAAAVVLANSNTIWSASGWIIIGTATTALGYRYCCCSSSRKSTVGTCSHHYHTTQTGWMGPAKNSNTCSWVFVCIHHISGTNVYRVNHDICSC